MFFLHVYNGFNNEQIHTLGHPPRFYNSLQEYLDITSHPNSHAGYIEIAAAQQLYNITINVVVAGTAALPPLPNPPIPNNLHVALSPTTYAPFHPCPQLVRAFSFSIDTRHSNHAHVAFKSHNNCTLSQARLLYLPCQTRLFPTTSCLITTVLHKYYLLFPSIELLSCVTLICKFHSYFPYPNTYLVVNR